MDTDQFRLLLQQVRAGNADAATQLVREYEPAIRRYVRVHLTDARLRQVLDTMDVCQSVLANFFVRVVAGQFDLEQPEQLLKLLATMARNRLLNHARDQQAACRDQRRQVAGDAIDHAADSATSPSSIVAGKDLLETIQRHLAPPEQELLRRRLQGQEWAEIAEALGGSAEAQRKKLARAMDRVTDLLGLDAVEDG
jgi:RNA polymerase sigma factor (sigma-70 family)